MRNILASGLARLRRRRRISYSKLAAACRKAAPVSGYRAEPLEGRVMLAGEAVGYQGPELLVNSNTTGDQTSDVQQTIAADDNGDFVVCWTGADGDREGVFARLYDNMGIPLTEDLPVNQDAAGRQRLPSVAMAQDGGYFVVAWEGSQADSDGWDIYARVFNTQSATWSATVRANNTTDRDQRLPAVGMDENGDFVVAWQSNDVASTGWDVYWCKFNNEAHGTTNERALNGGYPAGDQQFPAVAMNASGEFIAAWQGEGDGDNGGIYARQYDGNGSALGTQFMVDEGNANEIARGQYDAAVAINRRGNFAIAWDVGGGDNSGYAVFAEAFDSGASTGRRPAFLVNATQTGNQDYPSVACDDNDNLVITWEDDRTDGNYWGIYATTYDATGLATSGQFVVNKTSVANDQRYPSVAMTGTDLNGRFIVDWQTYGQEPAPTTASWGIHARVFGDATTPIWSSQIESAGADQATAIVADAAGNVYVTGWTDGALTGNTNNGSGDIFLAKYDAAETLQWVRQFGSSQRDVATGLSLDAVGNVYLTGWTSGSLGPIDGNVNAGNYDAFLAKYDAGGSQQWIRQFGTSGADIATGVSADALGNVFLGGRTDGALDGPGGGGGDAFVVKYDAGGTHQWARQFGGSGFNVATGVSADGTGAVYLSGWNNAFLGTTNADGEGAFLAKYDASGTQQWLQQLGSSGIDQATAVIADSSGNVYLGGLTSGLLAIGAHGGTYDGFLAKYDAAGSQRWIRQFGGMGTDQATGLSTDSSGNVYVTGTTSGLFGSTLASGQGAFLAKYNATGTQQWLRQYGGIAADQGTGVCVDGSDNVYLGGAGLYPANAQAPLANGSDALLLKLAPSLNDALPPPEVAISALKAYTADSKSLTVEYSVAGQSNGQPQPFWMRVYRSSTAALTSDSDAVPIAQLWISGDDARNNATVDARHIIAINPSDSGAPYHFSEPLALRPDPAHPYVIATADDDGAINPDHAVTPLQDSFRIYLLGVVTHGYTLGGGGQRWVDLVATQLRGQGYDGAFGFHWESESDDALEGETVAAGHRLAQRASDAVAWLRGDDLGQASYEFQEYWVPGLPRLVGNDVVDLHLIGHSRGAVVVTQAMKEFDENVNYVPQLRHGFMMETLLDPHPANNAISDYDSGSTLLDILLFDRPRAVVVDTYLNFQNDANDPAIVIPENVQAVVDFFQHTDAADTGISDEHTLNLWGLTPSQISWSVPVPGYNKTRAGGGHSETHSQDYQYIVDANQTLAYLGILPFLAPSPGDHGSGLRVAASGSSLEVMTQPGSLVAVGTPFSVVVQVQDIEGTPTAFSHDSVTIARADGGPLNGTVTVAAVNGVATFSDLTLDQLGAFRLVVGSATAGTGWTSAFNVVPAPATQLAFREPHDSIVTNVPFTLSVDAVDSSGRLDPLFSGSVTLSLQGSSGTIFGGVLTATAVRGVTTFSGLTIDEMGSGYTIQATCPGLAAGNSQPLFVTNDQLMVADITSVPLAARHFGLIVLAKDASGDVDSAYSGPITVTLGNLSGQIDPSFGGTLTVAAVNGVATFNDLTVPTAGEYLLLATTDQAASAFITLTVAPAPVDPNALQVSLTSAVVREGESIVLGVSLSAPPTSSVVVGIGGQAGGDPGIFTSVTGLVFTPTDWNVEQQVLIFGANDADAIHGQATFTISSEGMVSRTVSVQQIDKDAPAIGALAAPSSVVRRGPVQLVVSGVAPGTFGSITRVVFYRDANGNGRWDDTDQTVGQSTRAARGLWSLRTTATALAAGGNVLFARAQDQAGNWSFPVNASLSVQNLSPTLGRLVAKPAVFATPGAPVMLSATGARDRDGAVARVVFYVDSNANGVWDDGDVTLAERAGRGTLTWSGSVSGQAGDTIRFFARAQDTDGAWSNPAGTTTRITLPPTIGHFGFDNASVAPGARFTVTASALSDPDGSVRSAELYDDVDGDGIISAGDRLLLRRRGGGSSWTWTGQARLFSPGVHRLLLRVQDNAGAWSDPATALIAFVGSA